MAEPPSVAPGRFQSFYNDSAFADVVISWTDFAPKKMKPGVRYPQHISERASHCAWCWIECVSPLLEEHPDDKDVDIGDVAGSKLWMGMQKGAAYEMVLKYLYGMPIFTDGEDFERDLLLMLHDLAKAFEIPSLSEHTIVLFERSLEACIVDLETGLVKDKPQVEKFIQHIETLKKEDFKLLERVVVKTCCKHYSLICTRKAYSFLLGKHPQLPSLMLEYVSRQRDGDLL